MDYSTLSDFEINRRVAEILHPDLAIIESKSRPPCACVTGQLPSQWVDYCNNPADAWLIIANNFISVIPSIHRDIWFADGQDVDTTFHANPLRAAMIVFLMMQDKANANS